MSEKLSWGIIGTGAIAKTLAKALAQSDTGRLVAVASRAQETADRFGDEFSVPRRCAGYDKLLADPDVQAVYISTPHPMHAEWAIKAAEAGKHILCEKPLTLNHPEAMAVIEAARRNGVFLMEAFMYRCHPQTKKLVELVEGGAMGEVRLIQAAFSFDAGWNPEGRLLASALGGGGILDVGCYCTSMARLVAGAAVGKPFAEPIDVKAVGRVGETGVDEWAAAVLRFPGDIIAQVATGVRLSQANVVQIFGSEGSILVPHPWFGGRDSDGANLILHQYGDSEPQKIAVESYAGLYTIEADTAAAHIANRQAEPPAMTWDDTLGNMLTLDRWRRQIGVVYEFERPGVQFPTVSRLPLAHRPGNRMKYGRVDGLEKPVSRVVMGVMGGGVPFPGPHTSVMHDEFFSSGGNCFDTAYIYGTEHILGRWINNRSVRDQVVILDKGAHSPYCDPESLTSQLYESLDRLGTEYVDIYLMHRDNPEIPVGEFVEVLNEHKRAGRIRVFGGSNWTIERVEAANEYARTHGLTGFAAVSNNFSLARMLDPVWEGCIESSDAESRAWFTKTQMPLFAWSSLARGFVVYADPADRSDEDLVRCWYSEDNFERLARARELAARRGVPPVAIAMAYVLCQPFPVYALFGPATIAEMQASLGGLDVELTPAELRWLNLEG